MSTKGSICLFSSFFTGSKLPFYVWYYLSNLKPHFSKIVFITNQKEDNQWQKELENLGIDILEVQNEGYDFGMWGKAIELYQIGQYEMVALVNDSCILFRPLDEEMNRIASMKEEYIGLVISDRIESHIQSYFIVARGRAVSLMADYFRLKGLITEYRQVIHTYEIGMSQYMLANGVKIAGLYNAEHRNYPKNPSFARIGELIEEGIPMIKKKIMFRNYRGLEHYWVVRMNFNTDYRHYVRKIRARYPGDNRLIDFDRVMLDAPRKGHWDIMFYEASRHIANAARYVPGVKPVFRSLASWMRRRRSP
jgi:lipopolysaccharide biosynthesis protein